MSKWTKEYRKFYDATRYQRIKPLRAQQVRRLRQKKRDWFRNYKNTLKCSRCSETHPACLQFHHLRDKKYEVSDMIQAGLSEKLILREIKKCEVLCGNCHAKLHYKE